MKLQDELVGLPVLCMANLGYARSCMVRVHVCALR